MRKIPFLDNTAIAYLRDALNPNKSGPDQDALCELFTHDTNKELLEHLRNRGIEEPIRDTRFEWEPAELDPNAIGRGEVQNITLFNRALARLSPAVAANERVWAGLCIDTYWNYVRDRWHIKANHGPADIKSHFLFGFGARRSLTRNALSRLWWIGHLTLEKESAVNFDRATKFMLEDTDYVVAFLERNLSNNRRIVSEMIDGILEARAENYKVGRDEIRELAKYVNIVGGVNILDLMPEGAIKAKVYTRAKKLRMQQENKEAS